MKNLYMAGINVKQYPVEFLVKHKKVKGKTVEILYTILHDISYKEKLANFDIFIKSINDSIGGFFLNESRFPVEVYSSITKFTSSDYQRLFESYINKDYQLYFSILKGKVFKAINRYIREYFKNYTVEDIDLAIDTMKKFYPTINKSHFRKLKNNSFKNSCVEILISELDEDLLLSAPKHLEYAKSELPNSNTYTQMLQAVFSIIISTCSDEFLDMRYIGVRSSSAHKMLEEKENKIKTRQQSQKEKINKHKIKDTPPEEIRPEQIDIEVRRTFENIVNDFKNKAEQKLQKALKGIETYIRRMYKNHNVVYMKTIQEELGPLFDEEIIEFVRNLCTELDLQIHELDSMIENLDGIASGENVGNDADTDTGESTDIGNSLGNLLVAQSVSPTLEKFKTQPNLLQPKDVINIFSECGYTIANPKKFSKQLEKYITGRGSFFEKRKKRIIYCMGLPEDVQKNTDVVRETVSKYKVMKSNKGAAPRIIRKGDEIIACVDHDTYDRLFDQIKHGNDIEMTIED